MDAASALADLTEISSQVDAAVVFGEDGAVVASTSADESRTERLARVGFGLLAAAETIPTGAGRQLTRLEASLAEGSVFVARGQGSSIVATTGPTPASRLVFHDLETCLRAVAEAREQPALTKHKRGSTIKGLTNGTRYDGVDLSTLRFYREYWLGNTKKHDWKSDPALEGMTDEEAETHRQECIAADTAEIEAREAAREAAKSPTVTAKRPVDA